MKKYLEIFIVYILVLIIVIFAPSIISLGNSTFTRITIRLSLFVLMISIVCVACIINKDPVFKTLGLSGNKIGRQLFNSLLITIIAFLIFILFPLLFKVDLIGLKNSESVSLIELIFKTLTNIVYVGMCEEIVFRGYILEKLKNLTNSGMKSAIISSVMFGLCHFPTHFDLLQVYLTMPVGFLFAFSRIKFKNCTTLSTGIAHGLYNSIFLLLKFLNVSVFFF